MVFPMTLATGLTRWEFGPCGWALRQEGDVWLMRSDRGSAPSVALKPEVEDWCQKNLKADHWIIERIPNDQCGPNDGDSWEIEFESERDRVLFKLFWM